MPSRVPQAQSKQTLGSCVSTALWPSPWAQCGGSRQNAHFPVFPGKGFDFILYQLCPRVQLLFSTHLGALWVPSWGLKEAEGISPACRLLSAPSISTARWPAPAPRECIPGGNLTVRGDTCLPVSTVALFAGAKTCKQLKCQQIGGKRKCGTYMEWNSFQS